MSSPAKCVQLVLQCPFTERFDELEPVARHQMQSSLRNDQNRSGLTENRILVHREGTLKDEPVAMAFSVLDQIFFL